MSSNPIVWWELATHDAEKTVQFFRDACHDSGRESRRMIIISKQTARRFRLRSYLKSKFAR